MKKLSSGDIDSMKAAVLLKNEGILSEDIILMLDEMYLQKSNEYNAGNQIGADSEAELYRGILVFMIVGLKKSIS